jgi:hypothetical protein
MRHNRGLMRKICLSLLLPLFMLLAQQGAVWHSISHFGGSGTAVTTPINGQQYSKVAPEKDSSADTLCEICIAFAQLGGAAKSEDLKLSLLSFSFTSSQWVVRPTRAAELPAHRNRGPPYLL